MKHVMEKWGGLQARFKPVARGCQGLRSYPLHSVVKASSQGFNIGAPCFLSDIQITEKVRGAGFLGRLGDPGISWANIPLRSSEPRCSVLNQSL